MERMVKDMSKPDLLMSALIRCNDNYKQITQERKPTKQLQLKNVTPELENTITHTYGAIENVDCEEVKKLNQCVWIEPETACNTCCKEGDLEFRDALSYKEHQISGICQDCQDEVFGKGGK